jgi:hypothetical protein
MAWVSSLIVSHIVDIVCVPSYLKLK